MKWSKYAVLALAAGEDARWLHDYAAGGRDAARAALDFLQGR